ncbi:MAG: prolipoprotein diacylglyceryl transferase [Acutalibacteraceae bacterium]|nr:prolipoprotein diacylglyceryl transferase [Acutalibacteraceae bacterium]
MANTITIFGITLTINPVAFTIPIGSGWPIYWYGILIGTGCLLALIYGMKYATRFNIDKDRMLDVVLVTIPVAILCARAYYCIFDNVSGTRISSLKEFFGFGQAGGFSGLAIYGGVIGAFVCGALMCKLRKIKILDMFDLAALGFLIGQAIGRWGNFTNQEAYGTFTGSAFWGMQSDTTIREMGEGLVHPCFLYESLWCIIGFVILHIISKKRKFSGQIFLMYGAWYGFGRFFIEGIRTDSLTIGKIRVSQLVAALAFIACVSLLVYLFSKSKRVYETMPYETLFDEQMKDEQETTEEEYDEKAEEICEETVTEEE